MTRFGRLLVAHPWIVYAVLALLAFPILEVIVHGQGALQYSHDVFDDDVSRLFTIPADWRANGPVLWEPHLTAGNNLLAQSALPPLAPDVLLSFIVPPFTAYAINATLMAFAAGISMHLFLRDSLRLANVACFVGGVLAALAFWHYILGYSALMLPLLLWTTDRVMATARRRRDVVAAILLVVFLVFSSQIQIVLIDGAVALAWVLFRGSSEERPLPTRVASLVAVWVVAFLLAAPLIATQTVAISLSQRTVWTVSYDYQLIPRLADLVHLYGDTLFGVRLPGGIGGTADIYGSFFLGALGLPLLVIGVVVPRTTTREKLLLALLVIIPVIDLLAPLAAPIQDRVEFLRSFQFVRVRHLMPIVLIVNAAIGASWLAGPDPFGRLGRPRRWLAAAGLVTVGLALALQAVVAVRRVVARTGTPVQQEGWILGLLALLGGSIVALAIGILVVRRIRRGGSSGPVLVGGIAVVLLLGLTGERLAMTRSERDLGGNLGSWADRLALTPAQTFIASQPGGGRVLSIGDHANRARVAGLDAVDGYQTIYPLRYHELFGSLIAPELALSSSRYRYYHHWGNRAYAFGPHLDMAVADLLGVRWLYAAGTPLTDPELIASFTGAGVTVYENPAAFPRTFVVHDLVVAPDRETVVSAVGTADATTLRARVWLAAADVPAGGSATPGITLPGGPPLASDQATIETDAIDRLEIRATTTAPGILVLADTYTPDWVAEVDGVRVPVLAVDGALRGVALAPGEHVVTFSYRPAATYVGIGLALLAAVGLAGWLLLGRRQRASAARTR